MIIRPEKPEDIKAIQDLTLAAFDGKTYSSGTEHLVVNALRNAEALALSLVAEINENITGHVAFSKVTINGKDTGWFGLGPVSVLPEHQKNGIGSKLINTGLAKIRELGAKGCVLEGSPLYYQRFGFKSHPELIYKEAPAPEFFMALPFTNEIPNGNVEFHQAFYIKAFS